MGLVVFLARHVVNRVRECKYIYMLHQGLTSTNTCVVACQGMVNKAVTLG